MKKIVSLLAAALMLGSVSAFAQKVGVEAGFDFSTTTFDYTLGKTSLDMSGLSVGMNYEMPIGTSGLNFMPGIVFTYFSKNDANVHVPVIDYTLQAKLSESYLSIPLDVNFRLNLGEGIDALVYAGPTLSMGLTANARETATSMNYDIYDGALKNFTRYGRFDVLVGGGLGLELYDMLRFTVGYDYGLINRNSGSTSSLLEIHRSQFKVGVAYLF